MFTATRQHQVSGSGGVAASRMATLFQNGSRSPFSVMSLVRVCTERVTLTGNGRNSSSTPSFLCCVLFSSYYVVQATGMVSPPPSSLLRALLPCFTSWFFRSNLVVLSDWSLVSVPVAFYRVPSTGCTPVARRKGPPWSVRCSSHWSRLLKSSRRLPRWPGVFHVCPCVTS